MMIKNDIWITEKAIAQGMIDPFIKELVRSAQTKDLNQSFAVISYGLSSYGYDIRLSPNDFMIFRHEPGEIVDPKNFCPKNLEKVSLKHDDRGSFFILPGHSYGLGVSLEKLKIPANITAICMGKSSYARCGIIANITPVECEWEGHLTLELSNSSPSDAKIYASEGICQLLFFEGQPCDITYAQRKGKYQGQPESVVFAKV